MASIPHDDSVAAAPAVKPKRRKKLLKYLGYAALGSLAVALAAHVLWVRSGSGEWQLVRDENGVKVWSLKAPGQARLLVRGGVQVEKTRIASMIWMLESVSVGCKDAYCYDADVIDKMPSVPGHYAAYFKFKYDIPGAMTRQYVLLQQHWQDPASKVAVVDLNAAPNRLPRDPCCVRVSHLHNTWRFDPKANGDLYVELTQDTDMGELPYPLANLLLTKITYQYMYELPGLLKKDIYRNAQVDDIQEVDYWTRLSRAEGAPVPATGS